MRTINEPVSQIAQRRSGHSAGRTSAQPSRSAGRPCSTRAIAWLVDEFARRKLPHEVAVLPCGRYSTGVPPFSYLDAYVLTKFLRRL